MKILQASLVAGLLALSMQAQAALPPVHVDHGSAYSVGAATISISGVCAVKKQTYQNAEYGTVLDMSNNVVGTGFVSQEGQLLALLNGDENDRKVSGFEASEKIENVYYIDIVSDALPYMLYNVTNSQDCATAKFIPDAKSRLTRTEKMDGSADVQMNAQVDGIAQPKGVPAQGKFLYKKQLFSVKVTFKGEQAPPSA